MAWPQRNRLAMGQVAYKTDLAMRNRLARGTAGHGSLATGAAWPWGQLDNRGSLVTGAAWPPGKCCIKAFSARATPGNPASINKNGLLYVCSSYRATPFD